MPISSAAAPPINLQSQSLPSHPLQSVQQPKGHPTAQASQMSLPQSSQIPSVPPLSLHAASQALSLLQPPMPTPSTQTQQPLQTSGILHLPLQPPLPPQPRPPSVPSFPHQLHSQLGPNAGFQHSGAPQLHHSQPMFHLGAKPPPSMGPSFPAGTATTSKPTATSVTVSGLASLMNPVSLVAFTWVSHGLMSLSLNLGCLVGGSQLGMEFNNQIGSSIQADRGSGWMPGLPESTAGIQLPGPPPLVHGQMGPGNRPPRPSPLTPEMEKALLQQVMSLTPEQINLLPPEQRNQVLQLQQMLRH
ncbi:hypothetical protein F0562_023791 [Nyssa sinensis]|uniref:Transcription termination and cleavage factor C-terminal domain-containing protein n=1 Tax=Nyssa sinensis TaxID=561372 RepID=A0A5J5BKD3_9ASTE|nr:hypothetical protein F0562_023791 [Nyssa sinensis]